MMQINRRLNNKQIKLLIVIILTLAITSVFFKKKSESLEQETVSKFTVKYQNVKSETKALIVNSFGHTIPDKIINIKSETEGKISKLLISKGKNVNKNDPILSIISHEYFKILDGSNDNLIRKQSIYDNLLANKNTSKIDLAKAESELKLAKQKLEKAKLYSTEQIIRSPIDGYIEDSFIEQGDTINKSMNLLKIVQTKPILVETFIPAKSIDLINLNDTADVKISNDASPIRGVVSFIAKTADKYTKSFKCEILLDSQDYKLFGLTADVKIYTKNVKAFKIKPSHLVISDKGNIGVKILKNNIVEFHKIKILEDNTDHAWVYGIDEDEIRLITLGHGYVSEDEEVEAIEQK